MLSRCWLAIVEEGVALYLAEADSLWILGHACSWVAHDVGGEAASRLPLLAVCWRALSKLLCWGLAGHRAALACVGAASQPIAGLKAGAWQQHVLVLGRLRLLVDLLQELRDVASLALLVLLAKEDATKEWILLASLRCLDFVPREVGARSWWQLWNASDVLTHEPINVGVADGGGHFHGHEVVVDWPVLGHVGLVGVVNLVAEWLALLLGRGWLLHQALVDLLEVLLSSLDEVLLLRAGPVEVLQLVGPAACSGRNLVAVLL